MSRAPLMRLLRPLRRQPRRSPPRADMARRSRPLRTEARVSQTHRGPLRPAQIMLTSMSSRIKGTLTLFTLRRSII
eukprot:1234775-Pyramimonas_sp.AAC.1